MSGEKGFSLAFFIDRMEKARSMSNDSVISHTRTLEVFRMIMDNTFAKTKLLDSCTIEELEWVLDMIRYWPVFEGDYDDMDWNHVGVHHLQMRELLWGFQNKKSDKKKVTFI